VVNLIRGVPAAAVCRLDTIYWDPSVSTTYWNGGYIDDFIVAIGGGTVIVPMDGIIIQEDVCPEYLPNYFLTMVDGSVLDPLLFELDLATGEITIYDIGVDGTSYDLEYIVMEHDDKTGTDRFTPSMLFTVTF
jgi:hypothetical protein